MADEEEMEVVLLSLWDGNDLQTSLIAEFHIRFPDFEPPFPFGDSSTKDFFLLTDLEKEVQFLANDRFGRDVVKFECVRIVRGSLVILATLTVVGGTVYQFFKDYKDLREGVIAFVGDMKKITKELRSIVKKHLKPKDSGSSAPHNKRHGGSRSA